MTDDEVNMTGQYNTKLSAAEEQEFNDWASRQRALTQRDPQADMFDYDIKGWWKKNGGPDLTGAHLNDEFKKPNHPTFSTESKYHGVDGHQGGEWGGGEGAWTFTPGKTNMQMFGPDKLKDYFGRVEPDTKLMLPADEMAPQ